MDSSLLVKLTLVGIGMFQKQAHDAAKAEHVRKIYIKPLQIGNIFVFQMASPKVENTW